MKAGRERIKVCFLIIKAYPLFNSEIKDNFGGAEINLYNLAVKIASDASYEVEFFVGDYGQKNIEIINGIKLRKIKYYMSNFRGIHHKFIRELLLFIQLFKSDCDICINSTAGSVIGYLILILKKLKGKKVIYRVASDADTEPERLLKKKKYFRYIMYKLGIKNADVVVTQTENQKKLLMERMKIKSTVIRNGFFIEEGKQQVKDYILWVSRGVRMKRPELFVELARRLPDENFIIIMSGDKLLQDEVKESMQGLSNINFIDYVPFSEIQKYYDGAKLFVNTSEYEGFPNSFIQACLARTPLLSFRVNPDDFITNNRLGCFCRDDISAAEEFIRGLDINKINEYGSNALEYVRKNHNIEKSVQEYKNIIGNLLRE